MAFQKQQHVLDKIVVPTDFSPESARAMGLALAIARTRRQVTSVYAIDPFPYRFGPRQSSNRKRKQAFALARERMVRWLHENNFTGCDSRLIEGEPAPAVVKFASMKRAGLILLATSARRHAARFLLGSVAEEVFRQVRCPVVVLGPKANFLMTSKSPCLVFATDLEPHSLSSLPQLSKIASQLQAKILMIRAISRAVRSPRERSQLREETERCFKSVVDQNIRKRTKCIAVAFASPVNAISAFARRVGADAIVMGIRSGADLTRARTHIPWTIAHRIIASAKCPVVTLRG